MYNQRRRRRSSVNPYSVLLLVVTAVMILVACFSMFSVVKLTSDNDKLTASYTAEIQRKQAELDRATSEAKIKDEKINSQQQQISSLQEMKASGNQGSVGYTGPKVCYLTFDDGPSSNTQKILKILEQKNAKATWFVKNAGDDYNKYMTDIHNAGHTVAIHTYSHTYSKIYKSTDAYFEDLYKIQSVIKKYTGIESKICRFPGGSSNTTSKTYCKGVVTSIAKRMKAEGYVYFDWNADSGDASGNNIPASQLVANVKRDVGSQRCVNLLMHDTDAKDTTVEALPEIIDYLSSKGYTFESITTNSYAHHHAIAN